MAWYDEIDLKNVSEEKTNLMHDQAVLHLEELDGSKRKIDNKALVFLSYLFIVFGVLSYNVIFRAKELSKVPLPNGMNLLNTILISCLVYFILFGLTAIMFLPTHFYKSKFPTPKNILTTSTSNIIGHIKIEICLGLQDAIDFNSEKNNRLVLLLKLFISLSLILPVFIIILQSF